MTMVLLLGGSIGKRVCLRRDSVNLEKGWNFYSDRQGVRRSGAQGWRELSVL